jgi:LacI family transcriptional regulator
MTRRALEGRPRPTAIFAGNNFVAFGSIRALREAGLAVPGDMSIVVFDDLPAGWVLDPFMTVVSQPAYEIGRQAAELMLERLAGHSPAEPRTIVLPSELIIRRSTAPPSNEPASEVLTQLAQMENRA